MTDETTRRALLAGSGAALLGTVAGCLGDGEESGTSTGSPDGSAASSTTAASGTRAEATTAEEATSTEEGPYSVTMSPVGTVEFDAVPANVMAYSPQYADMLVSIGHADALNSLGFPDDYVATSAYYYDALDGVSFDGSDLTQLYNEGMDKEVFYELDSDVHLMDPAWASTFEGWTKSDTDEVRENVGPWFANRYSRQHADPPEAWADDYQFYTLWELSGKVAAVFREGERFARLSAMHDDVLATIEASLPPEDERPTVGLVSYYDDQFYPYRINGPGFGKAHTRPLGAVDVFAESGRTYAENYDAAYDFEGMLEYDPDVILHIFATTPWYDFPSIRETVADHPVGRDLTAIQNDRFYGSGSSFQGPIINLFQLEMTAKQLYPEQFGAWPGFGDGERYPEIPADERLFDREELRAIVTGS